MAVVHQVAMAAAMPLVSTYRRQLGWSGSSGGVVRVPAAAH